MIRTQIQLAEKAYRKLRQVALEEHRSMADCIREGISLFLRRHGGKKGGLSEIAGRFHSSSYDSVKPHDRWWADAQRVADDGDSE
jgi:hypothetical protein